MYVCTRYIFAAIVIAMVLFLGLPFLNQWVFFDGGVFVKFRICSMV